MSAAPEDFKPTAQPVKQPYWIGRADGQLFAFAGLYSVWRAQPEDPWLLSCAILTQPAHGPVEQIHDRMPIIIGTAPGSRVFERLGLVAKPGQRAAWMSGPP